MPTSPIGRAAVTALVLGTTLAGGAGRAEQPLEHGLSPRTAPTILNFDFDPLPEMVAVETGAAGPAPLAIQYRSEPSPMPFQPETMIRLMGIFGLAVDTSAARPQLDGLALAPSQRVELSANGSVDPTGREFSAQLRLRIKF